MSDSIDAKYQIVQERTLPVIASEILQIDRTVSAVAMDGAIQIGFKLQEAREKVPDGEWVKWLEENLNYSKSQAYRFIQISNTYGNENSAFFNVATSRNLSISKAFELLRLPEAEAEKFVEEHDIESETVKELRQEITDLQKAKEKTEAELKEQKEEVSEAWDEYYKELEASDQLRAQLKEVKEQAAEFDAEAIEKIKAEHEESTKSLRAEADTLKAANQSVTEKLEKAKEDLRKAKDKLKESEAAKDEEVQKRLAIAAAELEEKHADDIKKAKEDGAADAAASLGQMSEEVNRLEAQIEKLEAEKAKLSNNGIMKYGLLCEQLQETYKKIKAVMAAEEDETNVEKMKIGLHKIWEVYKP